MMQQRFQRLRGDRSDEPPHERFRVVQRLQQRREAKNNSKNSSNNSKDEDAEGDEKTPRSDPSSASSTAKKSGGTHKTGGTSGPMEKVGHYIVDTGKIMTEDVTEMGNEIMQEMTGEFHHKDKKDDGTVITKEEDDDNTTTKKHKYRLGDRIREKRRARKHARDCTDEPGDPSRRMSEMGEVLYPPVPPDECLQHMDIFLSKKIRGVTVQQFYDTIWQDPLLFHNWLEGTGKMEVNVGEWEYAPGCGPSDDASREEDKAAETDNKQDEAANKAKKTKKGNSYLSFASSLTANTVPPTETMATDKTNGSPNKGNGNNNNTPHDPRFVGFWCEEEYTQLRQVTFAFQRTSHLYIGPPIAHVVHTQWLRNEGEDGEERCILHCQVDVGDIPFGNTFNVQIRWVATRTPDGALQVQAGLYVNFVQAVLVANKIKSGTTEETVPDQQTLFEAMKQTLGAAQGLQMEEEKVEDEEQEHMAPEHKVDSLPTCFFFLAWLQHLFPPPQKSLVLAEQAMAAHVKLLTVMRDTKVRQLAVERATGTQDTSLNMKLESELTDIHSSLDEMLKLLKGRGRGGMGVERQERVRGFHYAPTSRAMNKMNDHHHQPGCDE